MTVMTTPAEHDAGPGPATGFGRRGSRTRRALRARIRRRRDRLAATGAASLALLATMLVAAAPAATAALGDSARLRAQLSSGTALAVLDGGGAIRATAEGDDPAVLRWRAADGLVPGTTLELRFAVANDGAAPLAVEEVVVGLDGALGRPVPEAGTADAGGAASHEAAPVRPFARVSIAEATAAGERPLAGRPDAPAEGEAPAGDGTVRAASATVLAPRTGARQAIGEPWAGGDAACAELVVRIHLVDDPALRDWRRADLGIRIETTGRTTS